MVIDQCIVSKPIDLASLESGIDLASLESGYAKVISGKVIMPSSKMRTSLIQNDYNFKVELK